MKVKVETVWYRCVNCGYKEECEKVIFEENVVSKKCWKCGKRMVKKTKEEIRTIEDKIIWGRQ